MGKKQSKRMSVERHMAVNPQATLKSVSKATGASYNYVYKINKALKETEAHARAVSNLLPLYTEDKNSGKSVAEQAEAIYAQRKDMNSVRAHVRKLEEQDRARTKQLNSKNVWDTITGVTSDPDLISELPPIGEAVMVAPHLTTSYPQVVQSYKIL